MLQLGCFCTYSPNEKARAIEKLLTRNHNAVGNVNIATEKATTDYSRENDHAAVITIRLYDVKRCYYLSNVRRDRFALEIRNLFSLHSEVSNSNSYMVVTMFDVRSTSSFTNDAKGTSSNETATIAAWSVSENYYHENENNKTELIELGKAVLEGEQDCRLVRDLIKEANSLVSLTMSAIQERQDKFTASLYIEQEDQNEQNEDPVIDISFSTNNGQPERDSYDLQNLCALSSVNSDNYLLNNEKSYAILDRLATDISILFRSRKRSIIAK